MIYRSEPPLQGDYIKVKTLDWVREYLSGVEFNIRIYAKSTATYADAVSAFIAAVDLRANDCLILNDDDSYSGGILALRQANLIPDDLCVRMLEAGGHDARMLMELPSLPD